MKHSFALVRKGLAAFSGLALLLGLVPFISAVSAAEDLPQANFEDEVMTDFSGFNNPFPDTDLDTQAGRAAAELFRRGVVIGQGDGSFHGSSLVNRAEAMKFLLLARYDDLPNVGEEDYPDVKPGDWFYDYVSVATALGIINGYPDGYFRPERPVNTVEFLKMLTLTFDLDTGLAYHYSDVDSTQWYAKYLGTAEKYDLFPNRETRILPAQSLTRDEVAVAMYQYLKNREDVQVEAPLHLAVQALNDATYSSEDGEFTVWKATLSGRAAETLALNLSKIGFKNTGTAADGDVHDFTLQIQGEGGLNVTSAVEQMEDDKVVFTNLFPDDDLNVSAEDSLTLTLRAKADADLSLANPTLRMELDLNSFEVADVNDNFLTVFRTTANASSLTVTLEDPDEDNDNGGGASGDLIEQFTRTPESRLLVAGTEGEVVGAFQLKSDLEDAEIDELTLNIEEVDTAAIFGNDTAADADAFDQICLVYSNGDPVLTEGGGNACVSSFTDGKANFQNLDLTAQEDEDLVIFVTADLNDIEDNGVAGSGMAFALNLSTSTNDSTIHGVTSGDTLSIADLNGNIVANQGNTFYVAANRLTFEEVDTSSALVGGDQRDLLRFRANTENDSDVFLRQIEVEVATSGGASVENVGLYNGDNELIAFALEPFSGGDTYRLTVGIEDEDGDGDNDPGSAAENDLTFDTSGLRTLPSGGDDLYEDIEADEIFTIRGDVSTDGSDDQVVTTVLINGSAPATSADAIIWRDSGGDNGESGVNIQWINLVDDDSMTRLEHILEN